MTFIENLGMVRDLGYVLDLTDTIGFDPDTRDRVLRESDPNYWDLLPDDLYDLDCDAFRAEDGIVYAVLEKYVNGKRTPVIWQRLAQIRPIYVATDITDGIEADICASTELSDAVSTAEHAIADDPRSIVRIRAYSVPCIIGLGDFDAYITWRDAVTEYPEPTFERIMKGVNA